MVKKQEKKKIEVGWIVAGLVGLVLILMLVFTGSNQNQINTPELSQEEIIWKTLDEYEDSSIECGLKMSSYIMEEDFESLKKQLSKCKSETDSIFLKINRWQRENPSKELEAAKFDIISSYYLFSLYTNSIKLNSGDLQTKEAIIWALNQNLYYLEKMIESIEKMNLEYSGTEYYNRYYLIRLNEVEQSKKELITLKKQIEETIEEYEKLE